MYGGKIMRISMVDECRGWSYQERGNEEGPKRGLWMRGLVGAIQVRVTVKRGEIDGI